MTYMHTHLGNGGLGDALGVHGHDNEGLVLVGRALARVGQ